MLETTLRPRSPYSLAASCAGEADATRWLSGGVLEIALRARGEPAAARVWQRGDGTLCVRLEAAGADAAAAHDELRFLLALDCDDAPFRERARHDALLAGLVRRRPGLHPLRVSTVTHALLRALTGQRISWSSARRLENRLLRAPAGWGREAGPLPPPLPADIRALGAAHAERLGLSPARAAALVGIARRDDPERLRGTPAAGALRWLERRPQLGPWSAAVVGIWGLGSYGQGLVGDLGLIKLCSALLGRPAGVEDTRALLAPYGEWAGLASRYLLTHPLAGGQRYREALAVAGRGRGGASPTAKASAMPRLGPASGGR